MISNVYSYYLSHYATKPTTKYNSHKRSELKSVYNKMVSINRTSPLYKLDLSDDMQRLAIDIKEGAMELRNFAAELSDSQAGGSDAKQKAVSSDEETVSVKYAGNSDAPVDEFEIKVNQLATSQINTGHYLQPKSRELAEGTYSFDLGISGITYELQFNVDKQDTTRDVQDKIVRLLNQSKIGVSADVQSDSLGNTAISIKSDATGVRSMKPVIFSVSDNNASNMSGSVEYLGLDRIVQYPSNAVFSVNGDERSSANNSFTINKAFEITLNKASEEPVTVRVEEDGEAIADEIDNFVSSYNRIVDFARKSSEKFQGGGRLLNEFERIAHTYNDVLLDSGFDVNDDGSIELSEEGRRLLSDQDEMTKVLSGLDGFKSSIVRTADQMISNPVEYMNKKIVAYKNPARSFVSPYSSSAYAGIMFDGYY